MATLVLGVAGGLIGSAIGGPLGASIGWSLGAGLGSVLFPQKVEGPRLTDLHLQNSQYGGMIPIVYGTIRIAGNVVWQTDLQEHEQKSGGKGGPEQTSYTYSASFAIRLCEGPVDLISKVWADGRLVYDGTQSYEDFPMTVYLGTEDQLPDPTIEAVLGAGEVPAYRGICYVVFEDMYLTDFGNRIPIFTFEVTTNGTPPEIPTRIADFRGFTHNSNPAVSSATMDENGIIEVCEYRVTYAPPQYWETTFDIDGNILTGPTGFNLQHLPGYSAGQSREARVINGPYAVYSNNDSKGRAGRVNLAWYYRSNIVQWISHEDATPYTILGCGITEVVNQRGIQYAGALFCPVGISGLGIARWDLIDYVPHTQAAVALDLNIAGANASDIGVGAGYTSAGDENGKIYVVHSGEGPAFVGTYALFELDTDLAILRRWLYESLPTSWDRGGDFFVVGNKLVASNEPGQGVKNVMVYDLENAFNVLGTMTVTAPAGSTLGSQIYLGDCVGINPWGTYTICASPTGNGVPLSVIVGDLSDRSALSSINYDVTELTDIVHGFVVANQAPSRNAIEVLQPAYAFDPVESGDVVRFVKRGKDTLGTIPDADLAAHVYGDEPPPALSIQRAQEMELPRVVSVNYLNTGADYQKGTQIAQRQLTTTTNVTALDLPVALSDNAARAMAEMNLYNAWMSRDRFEFVTSRKWIKAEPTDVWTVRGEPIRIIEKTEAPGGLLKFRGVKDGMGVYVQATVPAASGGYTPPSGPPAVTPAQATDLVLLDIPYITDTGKQNVFYAAMAGAERPAWKGAGLFQSVDGTNYAQIATSTTANTIGAATTLLGWYGGGNTVDESNTVTVQLNLGAGTLASVSLLQMLAGSNEASLGAEIIQYRDAELVGTRTYKLSGLLRGRRGTEWAMATHVIGDEFVLLPAATMVQTNDFALERTYKAVTSGRTIDTADPEAFTCYGAALAPYSPVETTTGINGSGDFLLSWKRRTRYGGEWRAFVDAPLSEEIESYQVLIYSDETYKYALVNETVDDATSFTFTVADQTTAFGSQQSVLYWTVAQWGSLGPGGDSAGQSQTLIPPAPDTTPTPTPLDSLPDLGTEMDAGFALISNAMQDSHANFIYLASLHLSWAYAYMVVSAADALRTDVIADLDSFASAGEGQRVLETFRGVRYQGPLGMTVPWGCVVAPGPTLVTTHPAAKIALPYADGDNISPRVAPLLGQEAEMSQGSIGAYKNYGVLVGQSVTVQRGDVIGYPDVYWNPDDVGSAVDLSNGNLTATYDGLGGGNLRGRANLGHSQGKYYFEVVADVLQAGSNTPEIGLLPLTDTLNAGIWNENTSDNGLGVFTQTSAGGSIYKTDCNTGATVATHTWVNGDVFMVAVDFDTGYIWFGLNGVWLASGDPSAAANPAFTTVHGRGVLYPAFKVGGANGQVTAHFDPVSFTYTAPTGFNPWRVTSDNGLYADPARLTATVSRGTFAKNRSVTLGGQQASTAQGTITPTT